MANVRWFALRCFAVFALVLTACGNGGGGGEEICAQIVGGPASGEIEIGELVDLDMTFAGDEESFEVICSSRDELVATVDANDVVTDASAGTVTITATDANNAETSPARIVAFHRPSSSCVSTARIFAQCSQRRAPYASRTGSADVLMRP